MYSKEYFRDYYLRNREKLLSKSLERAAGLKKEKANYDRQYREKNKEKATAVSAAYYLEHKEKIKEKSAEWGKKNPEKLRKIHQNYRLGNHDKIASDKRAYRKNHPESKVLSELKRRQMKRELGDKMFLTKQELCEIYDRFDNRCANCGCDGRLTIDHHKPLSKGNRLTVDNAVVLCQPCNAKKNAKNPEDFYPVERLTMVEKILSQQARAAAPQQVQ